jgi:hypothetical protein
MNIKKISQQPELPLVELENLRKKCKNLESEMNENRTNYYRELDYHR